MNHRLLAQYGLKWNPFSPELPTEAIHVPPRLENFCWRIEHAQIREGGFAMIHGEPGTGKSVALRVLADRLARIPDVTVGVINHPQSNIADLYRELGDVFGVPLRPHNRWGGFKSLRSRWLAHLQTTRSRAVLLVDEAQTSQAAAQRCQPLAPQCVREHGHRRRPSSTRANRGRRRSLHPQRQRQRRRRR